MMSEWMVEKPSDFNENWYITPCPKGQRVLLVATMVSLHFILKKCIIFVF